MLFRSLLVPCALRDAAVAATVCEKRRHHGKEGEDARAPQQIDVESRAQEHAPMLGVTVHLLSHDGPGNGLP